MSLAQLLKESTSEAHRIAESKPFQRETLRGDIDLYLLKTYFVQLHTLHLTLENHFDEYPEVGKLIDWSNSFHHSKNLTNDIQSLCSQEDENQILDRTNQLVDVINQSVNTDPLTLVGFFYVLEGSMNGNRYIVRAVRGKNSGCGCSFDYFDPYGENQPEEWSKFKGNLEAIELDTNQESCVVNAALEMFNGIGLISDAVMTQPINA